MKKTAQEPKVTDNPLYHDTWMLLRKYRDVVWSLELSVQQVRRQFQIEYGSSIEEFLESLYVAGITFEGSAIEDHARCIERSYKMLKLLDTSVELLRTKHKYGESYYWLLYYTYLSPQQLANTQEIIEKLEPRNYKVDAYYLPDADGTINEVYIYQNGRYIATCKPVARYNENTAEQTEYDKAAYTEQSKYVAQFDKMMKDGKIKRVGILAKEEAKLITEVQAEAVPLPAQAEEEDYSAYMDISAFEHDAVAKI